MHQENGLFGRVKQLLGKGPFTIPVYVNAEGGQSDRATFYVNTVSRSKAGRPLLYGMVRREDGKVEDRTVRLDRIRQGTIRPNRGARFLCLKRNHRPVMRG